MLLAPTMVAASREPAASAPERTRPGEPTQPRVSADRTGFLQTSDGLTLRLTTDLGSVKIVPLESGSAPAVRYAVHIETDARTPLAQHLLEPVFEERAGRGDLCHDRLGRGLLLSIA